jgi:hypothetical protein
MIDGQVSSVVVGTAEFLVGSVLTCLGVLTISGTAIILNRLFTKYWQPVKLFKYFEIEERKIKEPTLNDTKTK